MLPQTRKMKFRGGKYCSTPILRLSAVRCHKPCDVPRGSRWVQRQPFAILFEKSGTKALCRSSHNFALSQSSVFLQLQRTYWSRWSEHGLCQHFIILFDFFHSKAEIGVAGRGCRKWASEPSCCSKGTRTQHSWHLFSSWGEEMAERLENMRKLDFEGDAELCSQWTRVIGVHCLEMCILNFLGKRKGSS